MPGIKKRTGFGRRNQGTHAFGDINVAGIQVPSSIVFTIAQNATQYGTEIQAQVCDSDGNIVPGTFVLDMWLSDVIDGQGLTAVDPASTISAKAASGVILGSLTSSKAFRCLTKADGTFTLQILDDATPVLLYAAASLPSYGIVGVSRKTVAGDYKP